MKNYCEISEFAALCGLSRDTLLHYDRIGILKPAFVAPSGYRYYTLSQFTTVDLIAVLKASGTPRARSGATCKTRTCLPASACWRARCRICGPVGPRSTG